MTAPKLITAIVTGSLAIFLVSLPVYAQASPAPTGKYVQTRITNLQNLAVNEINARITALNNVLTKLAGIRRITTADKTTLTASIQTQIQALQTLLAKIQADTDLAVLRADVQSITKVYRIFWLYIPQVHIYAAADRINDVVTSMNVLAAKLQARITAAGSAGVALQTTLNDAQAKIAAAQSQAQAAVNLVTPLQPDNGNQTVLQSNLAVMKQAKTDIQTAASDLRAAWQDFRTIISQLK